MSRHRQRGPRIHIHIPTNLLGEVNTRMGGNRAEAYVSSVSHTSTAGIESTVCLNELDTGRHRQQHAMEFRTANFYIWPAYLLMGC